MLYKLPMLEHYTMFWMFLQFENYVKLTDDLSDTLIVN